MIASHEGHYITDLAKMVTKAHRDVDVGIRTDIINEEKGFVHTFFENGDELIVYDYDTAQINALSKLQKDKYAHRLFFDYKLPEGAVRAVIKKLDLLDYMVNIGICSEKSGGK